MMSYLNNKGRIQKFNGDFENQWQHAAIMRRLLGTNEKRAEIQRNYAKVKRQHIEKERVYIARQSLAEFNETSVQCDHVGRMSYICSPCGAVMYNGEQTKGSIKETKRGCFFSMLCTW